MKDPRDTEYRDCQNCDGEGFIISVNEDCDKCEGSGQVEITESDKQDKRESALEDRRD